MTRAAWRLFFLASVLVPGCRCSSPEGERASKHLGGPVPPIGQVDAGIVGERLPRALYRGGRFLRRPRLVTVTFAGEDETTAASLERFASIITTTAWWHAVVESYCTAGSNDCVGEGTAGKPVRLDLTLPSAVRGADVEAILERAALAGQIDIADPDTLLLAYLPAGVALSDAYVARYCESGPRAFHRALAVGDRRVAVAVVPRCGDLAELTSVASHELVEATTNPEPAARGFAFEGGALHQGFTSAGLEPVDPCGVVARDRHRVRESGFTVQRAWSNREAALGHDPCVPHPSDDPYLAFVPDKATVRLANIGDEVALEGVAASDRSAGEWSVTAVDLTGAQARASYVEARIEGDTVKAGERRRISLKRVGSNDRAFGVVGLVSKSGDVEHLWPLAVVLR